MPSVRKEIGVPIPLFKRLEARCAKDNVDMTTYILKALDAQLARDGEAQHTKAKEKKQ